MEESLQEFTLYELLSHSRPEHHANIRMLWADPKVQYMVLFADDQDGKAIITVGPELDYRTLAEIQDIELDGMIPVAFIKGRHFSRFDSPRKKILERLSSVNRTLSKNPFGGLYGVAAEEAPAGRTPAPTRSNEGRASPQPVGAPSATVLEKASTDEAWAELRRKEEGIENLRQELLAREGFITESENRLLEISQQHHEQQEELNHRLESLKKWEAQLEEREARLNKMEANAS
ncbi:MAG: hypothetical protein ACFB21_10100 [Opitutales bacterium]